MANGNLVFDRQTVRLHRDRAAPIFANHNFLKQEVAERLADRLQDIRRTFPLALDLGSHCGDLSHILTDKSGIEKLVQSDLSFKMMQQARGLRLVADEEALPFSANKFDLVISALSLHWVNDLPGTFVQIRQALKPDGLFLACLLGGSTLNELRQSLLLAEAEILGGISPRISPFLDLQNAAALLQRAGFALPVADTETITVTYLDAFKLMHDLRGMGETNACLERSKKGLRRSILMRAAAIYAEKFGASSGRLPASFQLLFLLGWKPHESQPKPLKRGSGQIPLGNILQD